MNFPPISKKHALVALGIVFVLSAISLGTFALAQPTQNVAPALLGTITPTPAHPDWKEYSNPAFGYSLRYPPNMVYREWQPAADILHSVSFYDGEDVSQPIYLIPEVSVTVFANPNKQSPREWTIAHSIQAGNVPDKSSAAAFEGPSSPRAARVAGSDGVTIAETAGLLRGERAILSKDNTIYSIAYTDLGDAKLKSTHADILSTLRLTAPSAPIQLPSITAAENKTGVAPSSPSALSPSSTGYRLPWASGETYRVLQTWGGATHRCPGQMCYAYDFDNGSVSFEGVPVRASADGVVAFVKGDSAPNVCGGYDYRSLGNYVVVYHTDGTATLYLHLKQASVGNGPLSNGRGTVIGLAGKTGWTGCYAHLHFQRQAQGSDWATNSVPVYFDEYPGQQLKYLERYTSQNTGGGTSTCSTPSPNRDQIGLYQHDNYCGAYKILGIGEYPNPAAMGFANDTLSSVKVGADVSATLCRDDNYAGGCVTLFSDNPVLRNTSVGNDQVSSVKISTFQGEWKGEYFNNQNLSATPSLVRSDSSINFNWGTGSPGPGINPDHFSARWTRTLNFTGGTWRFTVTADDGVRLWLDDRLLIDKWINQRATSYSADVSLSAGNHSVKMEYYDNTVDAIAKLTYALVTTAPPGSGWHGQYFNNTTLSGSPAFERDDAQINFDWGTGSPGSGVGADRFSVRWTRTLNFAAGTWRFTATVDDGVRLWVDDRLVIDKWIDQSATSYSADVALSAGNHNVKMEYYDNTEVAIAKLTFALVTTTPPGSGWHGQYFNNMTLSGSPAFDRDDAQINFNWGNGSPGSGVGSDRFSVRWTRTLNLSGGTWRFTATADDGVRLWVDDRLVIDKWIDQSATSYSADVALSAGNHNVKMEYYDNTVDAIAKLTYNLLGVTPTDTWHAQYYNNMTLSGSPAMEREDNEVNFDWGRGSPDSRISSDHFSARWTRALNLAAGTWRFTVTADDGVRLWIDDRLVIDKWIDQAAATHSADVNIAGGTHTVKMEYYENSVDAIAKLSYSQVSAATVSTRPAEQPAPLPTASLTGEPSPVPRSATPTTQVVAPQVAPTSSPTSTPLPTATPVLATAAPTQAPSATATPTAKPSSTPPSTATLTPRPVLRSPTLTAPKPTSAPQSLATPTPLAVALQATITPKPTETPQSFEIEPPQEAVLPATPAPNPTTVTQAPASPLTTFCGGVFGLIVLGLLGVMLLGWRFVH